MTGRFERRGEPLLSRSRFAARLMRHALRAGCLVAAALLIGVLGYHYLEAMAWIDALLNASMILSGMGPAAELHTAAGKLFASAYAIFSGIVFIALMGILLTPFAHRLMHAFHLDEEGGEKQ